MNAGGTELFWYIVDGKRVREILSRTFLSDNTINNKQWEPDKKEVPWKNTINT